MVPEEHDYCARIFLKIFAGRLLSIIYICDVLHQITENMKNPIQQLIFFFKCTIFFQMYQLQVGLYRRSNCLFWTPSHVHFLTVFFEYLGTGTGGHQRDGADFPAAVKLSQEKDGCQRRP